MSKIKVAVIQYDIVWENVDDNIKLVEEILQNSENADLYILPEMFNTGFTNKVKDFAEDLNGKTLSFMKNFAKQKNAAICGSMILVDKDKYYNSFLFVRPNGEITRYDKRHLFKMGGEADMFTQGKTRVVCEYKEFRFLLQVCYDLRFPVWSRSKDDYDAVIYIANWPGKRQYSFDTLAKARAIENLSYVLTSNRIGVDGKDIDYYGGSSIIDPKGKVIAETINNSQDIAYAYIDNEVVKNIRNNFTALQDADNFIVIDNE